MSSVEPTDRICQARRHLLSSDEERSIATLLQVSYEARLANLLLTGFEAEGSIQRGDDALTKRLVDRALTQPKRPRARGHRWRMLNAAAAVLLVAGAATAWRANWHARYHTSAGSRCSASSLPSQAPVQGAVPAALERASAQMAEEESPPASTSSVADAVAADDATRAATTRRSTVTPANAPSGGVSEGAADAAELFARANRLRRQGDNSEAVTVYRRLLQHHSTSREAPPARLALAKLLSATHPSEALGHYRQLSSIAGSLQAEALWGMAELAHQLDQRPLEQRAASELLRLFPESPYADVLRGRLEDAKP